MKAKEKTAGKLNEETAEASLVCVICGQPATRLVDGDPSCEEHAELVYEDQVEAYTQRHMASDDWLEKKS